MRPTLITFVLFTLVQANAGGFAPKKQYCYQQEPRAQASEKQTEAEQLSSEFKKLFEEGKFDEALPVANRILELREEAFGADDVSVANAASNLAEVYIAQRKFQKAAPLLLRAIQINDKTLKPADPILVKALKRYACVLTNLKQQSKLQEFEKARLPLLKVSSEPDRFWGALWLVTKAKKMPRPQLPQASISTVGPVERILVEVTVNEQGKVTQAQSMCVRQSSFIRIIEQAANQAEFEPILIAGRPIRAIGYVTYTFVRP